MGEPTPNGKFYFSTGKDIYVSDYDGGNPRKVATAPGIVDDIACSPDGSKLRFTVFDLGKDEFSIWEVASDGNGMHPLLPRRNDLLRIVAEGGLQTDATMFFKAYKAAFSTFGHYGSEMGCLAGTQIGPCRLPADRSPFLIQFPAKMASSCL